MADEPNHKLREYWDDIHPAERPLGWDRWDYQQAVRWRKSHERRRIKKDLWVKEIENLAKHESRRPIKIYVADGDRPHVIVEATYGPLQGLPASLIKVQEAHLTGHEDHFEGCPQKAFHAIPERLCDLPAVFFESTGSCGPRRFLAKVFQVIGYFGGNATVTMKPSGLTFTVDPEQFRQWVKQPEKMVLLLAGDLTPSEDLV